jgi:hypothetical protein
VIEVCNFVDAGTSIALFAQAREDFHEQTAIEAVIIFLQTYGRPRQMTFDRDPRSRWGQRRARFSFSLAPSLALSGDRAQHLSKASPRQACLRGEVSSNLWPGVLTAASASNAAGGARGD